MKGQKTLIDQGRKPDGWIGFGCGRHGYSNFTGIGWKGHKNIDCRECNQIPMVPYWVVSEMPQAGEVEQS